MAAFPSDNHRPEERMTEKLEFASAEWQAELVRTLEAAVAEAAATGPVEPFSLCELYTDVPAHLHPDSDGSLAWHVRIAGAKVEFSPGKLPDADLLIMIDYATAVPDARTVYGTDADGQARAAASRREARKAGKLSFTTSGKPAPAYLAGLHDHLAALTA